MLDGTDAERACSGAVVDAAMHVHSILGSGLLEGVYAKCLARELTLRGRSVRREVPVPIIYKGERIDCALRLDMIVDDLVVVETKTVEQLHPAHTAQLLTYLALSGCRVGVLLNFHAPRLKDGIKRIVSTRSGAPRLPWWSSAPPR
jgi:GxxExxY protein